MIALRVFVDDPQWRSHAACATPAGVLTMELAGEGHAPSIRKAKDLCATCPMADACLLAAIKSERGNKPTSRWSVRGGLDPQQRADLNKEQATA